MTVERIDTATGEVIDRMTEAEARRLTTEAQSEFRSAVAHHDRGWQIVVATIQAGGHEVLGYRSSSDYLEHEFAEVLAGLDVSGRRVAVRELSKIGMSTRAIAPVVGVSQDTVVKDRRRQVKDDLSPEPESLGGYPDHGLPIPVYSGGPGGVVRTNAGDAAKIIGRDGKTYTRPERPSETAARLTSNTAPAEPRRRPIADAFWQAAYDLNKRADTLARLIEDDRFGRNRDAIAMKNLPVLQETANTLARVLAAIESQQLTKESTQ